MKRPALYIFSFCCLAVYILSLNRPFMEWWADYRTYHLNAAYAKARYGDLYSNCFLPGYLDTAYIPLKEYNERGNTNLYILHDSYLEGKIEKRNFKNIDKLVSINYNDEPVFIKPDSGKKNVLVIECSERAVDWRLADLPRITSYLSFEPIHKKEAPREKPAEPVANYFFNPNINQNLEFSLYDYEYFIPVKSLKAQLNYSLFNRLPRDVTVSSDGKYLFLNETVDPSSGASSFITLDSTRLHYLTQCINGISEYFKDRGFDEVYFSIVPNPVSILDPKRYPYNHKIEKLENDPYLKARYISVYSLFKNTNQRIYRRDDSHWNGHGLQIWIDEVNKELEK
jgi:hypothetical protein